MKKDKIIKREPLSDRNVDIEQGLSQTQIDERTSKGYINNVKISSSKSVLEIFTSNIFSFFNLLCFMLFIWLISVIEDFNDVKNLAFIVIIFLNITISIFQELSAKKTMDALSLISSPDIMVLRKGEEISIKVNEILKDDIIRLATGNQICSDSIIVSGNIEVNEALLTGESLPIKKEVGDKLLSGSFVVSGSCVVKVENIAEENYIQKLAIDAKQFKKTESELIRSLKSIFKIIGFIILPIGLLAFLTNFNDQLNTLQNMGGEMFSAIGQLPQYTKAELYFAYKASVTPTASAMIGMIPAGLFLLTSVALAVGIVRLAKRKALVQELYSIETLARVDMLCLDKTGTITDGTMKVKEYVSLIKTKTDSVPKIISSMLYALSDNNQTSLALRDYFKAEQIFEAEAVIPFNSDRKCSAVTFSDGMYILGAPEYVSKDLSDIMQEKINGYSKKGYRCLLLGLNKLKTVTQKQEIPDSCTPLAIIVIQDNIKADAKETLKYFLDNGVQLRVISGDNPITVSEVAKRVGIPNADKYISLHNISNEEIIALAKDYAVFGRVSPAQKKLLVKIFKSNGHTVAMTGDGINDILALKEADCSIAMANGSEATRNVAHLVLLDSNFASMPSVVGEGRRVVNNIERASTLFLTKTAFSFILQIMLIFMQKTFPILPVQLSFISLFAIGYPSFFLALEPNNSKIEGGFLSNIAKKILPGVVAMVINIMVLFLVTDYFQIIDLTPNGKSTLAMITVFTVFLQVLCNISKPFNLNRGLLFTSILVISLVLIIFLPMIPDNRFNVFNIEMIANITIVTSIFALVYLSENIIKFINYFIRKIENRGKELREAEKNKQLLASAIIEDTDVPTESTDINKTDNDINKTN